MNTTSLKHEPKPKRTLRGKDHDESMVEVFRKEPDFAIAVLNSILEDGDDQGELLILLRQMTKAFGGVSAVARKAKLNQTQLYRTLSQNGNPSLNSLVAILRSMKLQLVVKSVKTAKPVKAVKPVRQTRKAA